VEKRIFACDAVQVLVHATELLEPKFGRLVNGITVSSILSNLVVAICSANRAHSTSVHLTTSTRLL
jgi:hypothetical protein